MLQCVDAAVLMLQGCYADAARLLFCRCKAAVLSLQGCCSVAARLFGSAWLSVPIMLAYAELLVQLSCTG